VFEIILNNKDFHRKLLFWFGNHKREFPWRETRDPFKIIISEITLKLTGAWKSIDSYNVIAENYGTPAKMAAAQPEDLKPLFKHLGIFQRCHTLVDISLEIINRFNGEVPRTYDELVSIKGIGQYTANAVLCFAYNERVPLVDGSVSRIFKRYLNYRSNKKAYADKKLWEIAEKLLPEKNYRNYNLAILDLGALICRHNKPIHTKCPIRHTCYTYIENDSF
jgi:A/G-specific adenine glycosylase